MNRAQSITRHTPCEFFKWHPGNKEGECEPEVAKFTCQVIAPIGIQLIKNNYLRLLPIVLLLGIYVFLSKIVHVSPRNIYKSVHVTLHNSQKLATTKMPIDGRMDKYI